MDTGSDTQKAPCGETSKGAQQKGVIGKARPGRRTTQRNIRVYTNGRLNAARTEKNADDYMKQPLPRFTIILKDGMNFELDLLYQNLCVLPKGCIPIRHLCIMLFSKCLYGLIK